MRNITIALLIILLSGCAASSYRPVVDPSVCPGCLYERDLSQCQTLAKNNSGIAGGAASGAAVGAGIFAVVGALAGVDVGSMAAVGATVGGARGAGGEMQTTRTMIARCMNNRGYSVLR